MRREVDDPTFFLGWSLLSSPIPYNGLVSHTEAKNLKHGESPS
jgi:hypothetical protein